MDGEINYNQMVERALLGVVRDSLTHAAEYGLSGQHHYYVTFKTRFPGVSIPVHLTERYKDEMTIVMQHQYWDLIVTPDQFSLDLSFNHKRETLTIPFEAVTAFADPSVQFGLQFNFATDELLEQGAEELLGTLEIDSLPEDAVEPSEEENKVGEVIALDAFRKK